MRWLNWFPVNCSRFPGGFLRNTAITFLAIKMERPSLTWGHLFHPATLKVPFRNGNLGRSVAGVCRTCNELLFWHLVWAVLNPRVPHGAAVLPLRLSLPCSEPWRLLDSYTHLWNTAAAVSLVWTVPKVPKLASWRREWGARKDADFLLS